MRTFVEVREILWVEFIEVQPIDGVVESAFVKVGEHACLLF